MKPGLYDKLIDAGVKQALDRLKETGLSYSTRPIDVADLPARIGEAVAGWVTAALREVPDQDRAEVAHDIGADVLALLARSFDNRRKQGDAGWMPLRQLPPSPAALLAVYPPDQPIGGPLTPLGITTLHTNAPSEPGIGKELLAEIDSADRIDLVLAFIRWSGIRNMMDALREHCARGRPLRIITTIYTNSTEPRALEELQQIGADIRVSYDTSNTRLHAKSWLFYRTSGYSCVYIGSSNLTFSAQATGLEWNVRATQVANPLVIEKFAATFESYWQSNQFVAYEPAEFRRALMQNQRKESIDLTPFDIKPHPFQAQILEKLQVERSRGRQQNLVVAATGTGKTVIAALDYKHLRATLASSRLLFVAHRKEILDQSRVTFRHVLRDGSFGERWVDGEVPVERTHVFASVQSLNARVLEALAPDAFDVVIVDEFHHAMADSYDRLLNHFKPRQLLGLTATPERADGRDTLSWFGGRIAAELRLWDALEQELLSPFHYYGIADGTDLRGVKWLRGRYDNLELTNLYTADDLWVAKVLGAVQNIVSDPLQMRAIGFCVSVRHAEFMAAKFSAAGIAAEAVSGQTDRHQRSAALQRLRSRELNILFSVDLFNEGVDLPAVDTLLMLRPTESATIFLQQLGRGLRKAEGKDVLTVLDFVGQQRQEFRFDRRFRRLLGVSRKDLERALIDDFPHLPAGCQINLDRVASESVLRSIRGSLPRNQAARAAELAQLGDVSLRVFLEQSMLELADVYAGSNYWTALRRRAGFVPALSEDREAQLGRGFGRILHYDDFARLRQLAAILGAAEPPAVACLTEQQRRLLQMFGLSICSPKKSEKISLSDVLAWLWRSAPLRQEFVQLAEVMAEQVVHLAAPLGIEDVPLQVHATYSRAEVMAAFGAASLEHPGSFREGVYWHEPSQTNLCFVTLDKTDSGFSPTTRYKDYAINEQLFHWETQSGVGPDTPTGKRYIEQRRNGTRVVLFARERKSDGAGNTAAFFCLGLADYVSHQGERPIAITWQLRNPLPGDRFAAFRAAVA